jgi:hypothetical protein
MIEFQAGSGPDTQAVGIAMEEMFLDYRLMPGRAPLPVIAIVVFFPRQTRRPGWMRPSPTSPRSMHCLQIPISSPENTRSPTWRSFRALQQRANAGHQAPTSRDGWTSCRDGPRWAAE